MNKNKKLENQCAHSSFCIRIKLDHLDYCSKKKAETCDIAKEYDKYGEEYNGFGIGGELWKAYNIVLKEINNLRKNE